MKNENVPKRKYSRAEGVKFIFKGKDQSLISLSTTYKDYLYGDKSKYGKSK